MNWNKVILSIAAAALSQTSWGLGVGITAPSNVKVNLQAAPTGTAPVPIRQAKARGSVKKVWNEKQSDGTYKPMSEDVCTFDTTVPVFENQGNSFNYTSDSYYDCKSDLKVGPSTIRVFAVIVLFDNMSDPIDHKSVSNWKAFFSGFVVNTDKGNFSKLGGISAAAVENQTENSMLLQVNSNDLTANGNGDVKLDENLSLNIVFQD